MFMLLGACRTVHHKDSAVSCTKSIRRWVVHRVEALWGVVCHSTIPSYGKQVPLICTAVTEVGEQTRHRSHHSSGSSVFSLLSALIQSSLPPNTNERNRPSARLR